MPSLTSSQKCLTLCLWAITQQALSMHIRNNPDGAPDMEHSHLPQNSYGIPIPQELTEEETNSMKPAVNHFMSNTFGVQIFYFSNILICTLQKGLIPWEKNKSTTWDALQKGDYLILAGLCATIFQGSAAWRRLAIETGTAGLAATPIVKFAVMRDWFAHNHICRKSAEKLVNDNAASQTSMFVLTDYVGVQ